MRIEANRRGTPAAPRRYHSLTAMTLVAVLAMAVSGCGSEDGSGDGSGDGAALSVALGRIGAAAAASQYVAFGDVTAIDELSGGTVDGPWGSLIGWGTGNTLAYQDMIHETLGIDTAAADIALTVGTPPTTLTLFQGGQDADSITASAQEAGWSGDDVLSAELDAANPLTVSIPTLRATGSDVVLGGTDADLSLVDSEGDSLADDATLGPLADCLGEVTAALLIGAETLPYGLAVRPAGDDNASPVGLMCVVTGSSDEAEQLGQTIVDDVESGTTGEGRPYSDYFHEADMETLDEVVRVHLPHSDDAFGTTLFQLADTSDLPGLGEDAVAPADLPSVGADG